MIRMITSLSRVSNQKIPKSPRTLIYKFTLSTYHLIDQFPSIISPLLEHCPANLILQVENLLINSTNLLLSRQIHACMIRTHYLESSNGPHPWNNIIRSYTRLNSLCYAFNVYLVMLRTGILPDRFTLPIMIKAVGQVYSLRTGQQFHGVAIRCGLERNEFVESGLISLYGKAGDCGVAYKLFDESPNRTLGCWNAVIAALAQNGRSKDALVMFLRMRSEGIEPDGVTMVSVTSACGGLGDMELAQRLHNFVFHVKFRRNEDLLMVNSVIDMYGKCGRMDLANRVFSVMGQRNVSSWTSMIVGYANLGHVKEAMDCFRAMIEANVMPNHVTFLGVLRACVHGRMVDEGRHWFEVMKNVYGIEPGMKHYGCMVDLLGRAGQLEEAVNMVKGMPFKPHVEIWGCLLGACERYNDVVVGEWVAEHFLEIEPENEGIYIVLSNIYANRNMWEDVERIREIMLQRRLPKIQGYSSAIAHF